MENSLNLNSANDKNFPNLSNAIAYIREIQKLKFVINVKVKRGFEVEFFKERVLVSHA